MHTPGAEGLKIVHPADFPCVQAYVRYRNDMKQGPQVTKCVHQAAKVCTPGAGCTLNFEHLISLSRAYKCVCVCVCVCRGGTLLGRCCHLGGLITIEHTIKVKIPSV